MHIKEKEMESERARCGTEIAMTRMRAKRDRWCSVAGGGAAAVCSFILREHQKLRNGFNCFNRTR